MKPSNRKQFTGNSTPFSDANTYEAKAREYCQRSGREDGTHIVIVAGTREWALWMEYFTHIGHSHAKKNSFANNRGRLTVPASTPDAFEPGWKAGESYAEKHSFVSQKIQLNNQISPEEKTSMRLRMNEMYQSFRKNCSGSINPTSRDARDAEADKREAIKWLEEKRLAKLNAQKEAIEISDRLDLKMAEMFGKYFEF